VILLEKLELLEIKEFAIVMKGSIYARTELLMFLCAIIIDFSSLMVVCLDFFQVSKYFWLNSYLQHRQNSQKNSPN
jgi:hypothetical protein